MHIPRDCQRAPLTSPLSKHVARLRCSWPSWIYLRYATPVVLLRDAARVHLPACSRGARGSLRP